MTTAQKEWMAELLNRFPMVRWDRLAGAGLQQNAFGWIDRRDGRHDFLVLSMTLPHVGMANGNVGYVTSSAEHSERIGQLLYGAVDGHTPCRRVEHELQSLVESVVHL